MGIFEDIFFTKEDFEKKKNEHKEEENYLNYALDILAEMNPEDKVYDYAKESFSFTNKVSSLVNQKYDNQTYEELTNMIEQFDRILNDYLKEKGLKYEG